MSEFWQTVSTVAAIVGFAVIYIRLSNDAALAKSEKRLLESAIQLGKEMDDKYVHIETWDEFQPNLDRTLGEIKSEQAALDDQLKGISSWLRDIETRTGKRK